MTRPTPCQQCKADLVRARASNETLESRCRELQAGLDTVNDDNVRLLARVKELEGVCDDYFELTDELDPPDMLVHWRHDRAKLAAANALLDEVRNGNRGGLLKAIDAHLSGQPAAPSPVPFTTVQGETFTHCTMPERAVLKAVYAVPTRTLERTNQLDDWREVAKAELARRATEGQTTRDT